MTVWYSLDRGGLTAAHAVIATGPDGDLSRFGYPRSALGAFTRQAAPTESRSRSTTASPAR